MCYIINNIDIVDKDQFSENQLILIENQIYNRQDEIDVGALWECNTEKNELPVIVLSYEIRSKSINLNSNLINY
jgi:hypothetical protein